MNRMFERWKKGEIIRVQARRTGMIFSIQPEQWAGITIGYTILVDGKPVPGYIRKLMSDAQFQQWCQDLIELEDDPA